MKFTKREAITSFVYFVSACLFVGVFVGVVQHYVEGLPQ